MWAGSLRTQLFRRGLQLAEHSTQREGAGLDLDRLLQLIKDGRKLPQAPFLASDRYLSPYCAVRFEFDGREYIGAHPSFWRQAFRPGSPDQSNTALALFGVPLIDLDTDNDGRRKFFDALMGAMRKTLEDANRAAPVWGVRKDGA